MNRRGNWAGWKGLKIWTGAAICVGSLSLPAQTPDANTIAGRVDRHYNSLHSLSVAFSESYDGLGIHRVESGTLLLRKPARMRWDYTEPKGKLFLLDGRYAYFYTPGDTQAQRIRSNQVDDLRSPLQFLLGHTKISKELTGLELAFVKTSAGAGSGVYILSGVPKGDAQQAPRLTLLVSADGAIRQMKIDEADGARTSFDFSNEIPNPPLSATEFVFTPPRNVPVAEGLPPI